MKPLLKFLDHCNNYFIRMKEFISLSKCSLLIDSLKENLKISSSKLKDLGTTNFELGQYHLKAQNINDAIMRFKVAKFFNYNGKNFLEIDYYIGRCYFELFKFKEAKKYFNCYLALTNPLLQKEAEYCLKLINGQTVTQMPLSIVRAKFEYAAHFYRKTQAIECSYHIEIANAILEEVTKSGLEKLNVLDLGCGTGAIVRRLENFLSQAIGVDISEEILQVCSDFDVRKNYTKLVNRECWQYLSELHSSNTTYNVILAVDLITYCSDVATLLARVASIITANGLFICAFRITQQNFYFNIMREQFSYDPNYITEIAANSGFSLLTSKEISFLNKDKGLVIVFKSVAQNEPIA